MTNYAHGHDAEKVAAQWLQGQGYKIVSLNWRDRRAEIDIVARKRGEPLRFIEVKYRERPGQGDGFAYVTAAKLKQMAFAAQLYVAKERYGGEYTLAALEVSGQDYAVTGFIESII